MSQRIVIIDDHSKAEIEIEQASKTRASITLSRTGQEDSLSWVSWRDLNLTDESWDLLIKTIREFCPDAQPDASALEADAEQASASHSMDAVMLPETSQPAPAPVKRDSKAIRAWYYALDAKALSALALPTPDRSRNIGKLPAAVYDAYERSQA